MGTRSFFAALVRMTFFAIHSAGMIVRSLRASKLASLLKNGAIGVIPTDTIYGISCSALDRAAVERVYAVRQRAQGKPFIILIASLDDLAIFGIRLSKKSRAFLSSVWPAPMSIIFPLPKKKFHYLHRGLQSLSFRLPARAALRYLLKKTGPLITTSANREGEKPAVTIAQAKKYFGASLDFYVDDGKRDGKPSTLLRFDKDVVTVVRQGSYRI